jgi:hypothetical protein
VTCKRRKNRQKEKEKEKMISTLQAPSIADAICKIRRIYNTKKEGKKKTGEFGGNKTRGDL